LASMLDNHFFKASLMLILFSVVQILFLTFTGKGKVASNASTILCDVLFLGDLLFIRAPSDFMAASNSCKRSQLVTVGSW